MNNQELEEDENGYDNLCKYSIEKCELCEMVFSSRFANIIHSSQHIIIPLIKQNIHKCKKCLHCFTSKSELKSHKQTKHKKKGIDENNDGEFDHEGSPIGQELGQVYQEESQVSYEKSEIGRQESLIAIDQKNSRTGKKITQNSHKESNNRENESQNETDDILRSIIMKQPIIKIDDIANIVAKTLLATKNDEEHSKIEKKTKTFEKASSEIQNERKTVKKQYINKKKANEKERFNINKVINQNTAEESIHFQPQTSQNNMTEELIPNKIIIGGKKRKSQTETDLNESKRDKKPTNTDNNKNGRDRHFEANVSNGVHITDLTVDLKNRQSFIYKEVSPDVISIKSDSSDEPNSQSSINIYNTMQSKRRLFEITYDEDGGVSADKNQSKNVPQKDHFKTVSQRDQSNNVSHIKIPFVIKEDTDNEANIDELFLLNNVMSPVEKSNFRSKIQFEDDENIQLLDLERELTSLTYEFQSVHYDELREPELCECKRCHMIFMNRLALYKHEVTHMRFRRTRKHYFCKYCENYFYGNHFTQKRHYERVHNTQVDKKKVLSCPVCKLQYYRIKEHYKKYHSDLMCKDCSTCFGSSQTSKQHYCIKGSKEVFIDSKHTEKHYDLLLVCELCFSFIKTTGNFKYEIYGEKCEVGTRQRCFYCTKEFFDVKIVKRINFMAAVKSQNLKNNEGKKKGQDSNAAKLLMIQKRLKAMKK